MQAREDRDRVLDAIIAAHTQTMEERYRNAHNTRTGTVAEMIEVGLLQPTVVDSHGVVSRPGTGTTMQPAAGYISVNMIPYRMAEEQVGRPIYTVPPNVRLALTPAPPERVEELVRAASAGGTSRPMSQGSRDNTATPHRPLGSAPGALESVDDSHDMTRGTEYLVSPDETAAIEEEIPQVATQPNLTEITSTWLAQAISRV